MKVKGWFSLSCLMVVSQQHEGLQVCKNSVEKKQMSAIYLDEAERWSKDLTRMRARGPGDTENAMRSIERDYGVDYWILWRLRYRKSALRDIGVTAYMLLKAAYQAECERQMRRLKHEIALTNPDYVAAAKALLGEIDEEVK
jgi:hypothetical protein